MIAGIFAALVVPGLTNVYQTARENGFRHNAQNISSTYNSARAIGISLPAGDDVSNVVQVLTTGVGGQNVVNLGLSNISVDQIDGAKHYLEWQPTQGMLQYNSTYHP